VITKRAFLALSIVVILLPADLNGLEKRVRIDRDDMIGTWIGLTTDDLQMIRLTLESSGAGIIGFSFLDEKPCVFRIAS